MATQLLVGEVADGFVIRVVGRGTMKESLAFRAAAEAHLGKGVLIFDARQCDYLDSTFLGGLIAIKKACEQSAAKRFVICASHDVRVKLFSTSALDQFFDFIENCPQPLGEMRPVEVGGVDPLALGRHSMRCHEELAERGGREAAAFRSVADCLKKEIGESGD